jgi:hypothetical protein
VHHFALGSDDQRSTVNIELKVLHTRQIDVPVVGIIQMRED